MIHTHTHTLRAIIDSQFSERFFFAISIQVVEGGFFLRLRLLKILTTRFVQGKTLRGGLLSSSHLTYSKLNKQIHIMKFIER